MQIYLIGLLSLLCACDFSSTAPTRFTGKEAETVCSTLKSRFDLERCMQGTLRYADGLCSVSTMADRRPVTVAYAATPKCLPVPGASTIVVESVLGAGFLHADLNAAIESVGNLNVSNVQKALQSHEDPAVDILLHALKAGFHLRIEMIWFGQSHILRENSVQVHAVLDLGNQQFDYLVRGRIKNEVFHVVSISGWVE